MTKLILSSQDGSITLRHTWTLLWRTLCGYWPGYGCGGYDGEPDNRTEFLDIAVKTCAVASPVPDLWLRNYCDTLQTTDKYQVDAAQEQDWMASWLATRCEVECWRNSNGQWRNRLVSAYLWLSKQILRSSSSSARSLIDIVLIIIEQGYYNNHAFCVFLASFFDDSLLTFSFSSVGKTTEYRYGRMHCWLCPTSSHESWHTTLLQTECQ